MFKLQEVKIIICSGLEVWSEQVCLPELLILRLHSLDYTLLQPVANIFSSESEPEDSDDAVFGRLRRRMAKAPAQHMGREWPVILRIAGPSCIAELWFAQVTRTRFAATDVLIFVLSTKIRTDFEHLYGLIVGEDELLLDDVGSPQLRRLLVATYSDASPDSWAVNEKQLNWVASDQSCELKIMSEEDAEWAIRVLDEAAGKVILWRAENGKLREKDAPAHNKQVEDGWKKIGRRLTLWSLRDKLFKRSQPR
ncbi:hypothetical protein BGW36DRAFT_432933 [Talaromyces proteolyticus]|uniref:Uncharacterized protein n=1 Tax=Talaromyces proteolyticus TaxID=1131652 RepID=A0AAD4PV62_9EURO|nr:uncharacterized protein BGW36DRAFT_432933 [Talaromyces proteolyticus]KAH8689968.1 hypothetical protein BGW36DRAFT_432933 [Talaromyces proteolyticus]